MKAVILAGGLGTRISEETHLRPKPMIEIGGKPILWHIMKGYAQYGYNDFILCLEEMRGSDRHSTTWEHARSDARDRLTDLCALVGVPAGEVIGSDI